MPLSFSLSFLFFPSIHGIHRATVLYLRRNVKLEESTEATIDIEPIDLCVRGIVCAIPISSLFIMAQRYRSTKSGKRFILFPKTPSHAEKFVDSTSFSFILLIKLFRATVHFVDSFKKKKKKKFGIFGHLLLKDFEGINFLQFRCRDFVSCQLKLVYRLKSSNKEIKLARE